MYNHAPADYRCPFCYLVAGRAADFLYSRPQDIIYQDGQVTTLISSHTWGNNRGNALVIPDEHYENVYDLPPDLAAPLHRATRLVALAMKEVYGCAGISTRQHNEPAGQQDVWHYHLHVFPRYPGDNLYAAEKRYCPPEEREIYAARLRGWLELKQQTHEAGF